MVPGALVRLLGVRLGGLRTLLGVLHSPLGRLQFPPRVPLAGASDAQRLPLLPLLPLLLLLLRPPRLLRLLLALAISGQGLRGGL